MQIQCVYNGGSELYDIKESETSHALVSVDAPGVPKRMRPDILRMHNAGSKPKAMTSSLLYGTKETIAKIWPEELSSVSSFRTYLIKYFCLLSVKTYFTNF